MLDACSRTIICCDKLPKCLAALSNVLQNPTSESDRLTRLFI